MLSRLMSVSRRVERVFGPDDRWAERLRQAVWRIAERVAGDAHTFVRDKGRADYVCTVDAPPAEVVQQLDDAGYQRNLLSTVKTRDGDDYAHLREKNFSPDKGVEAATEYLNENSYLVLKDV